MSLACLRHGHRLDLCLEGAAEGLWPQSSGGQCDGGPDSSSGGFFVVPLPPASEPERPPNKGTSRRRGRRRSRSFSLGRRWTRRPSPPSLPRACWFWGGAGEGTLDAPGSALASQEGAGESGVFEGIAAPESS